MQSSQAPLLEQGKRLWCPVHSFDFNSGLHMPEQGRERWAGLTCESLASWEEPRCKGMWQESVNNLILLDFQIRRPQSLVTDYPYGEHPQKKNSNFLK